MIDLGPKDIAKLIGYMSGTHRFEFKDPITRYEAFRVVGCGATLLLYKRRYDSHLIRDGRSIKTFVVPKNQVKDWEYYFLNAGIKREIQWENKNGNRRETEATG